MQTQRSVILAFLILSGLVVDVGLGTNATKILSGIGSGELLLNFTIQDTVPASSGRYNYNLVDINIPPIVFQNVTSTVETGYSYNLLGIIMPGKPNNFTVIMNNVKNLHIGLNKAQGTYENYSSIWNAEYSRVWVTEEVIGNQDGKASITSDLISPGRYQAKIFGDTADNVSSVDLTIHLVKKLIVKGRFNLNINTTGFPSGNYSMSVKALNGSFHLDEIQLEA